MTSLSRSAVFSAALFVLAGCTGSNAQSSDPGVSGQPEQTKFSEAGLRLIPLSIKSGERSHQFTVELASTGEQQARGLMFRKKLEPGAGMIFPFDQERMASFWMKNTVIPLDIIFVRSDGTIESIAAKTTPYSLEPVVSGEPVSAVLELAGGRAAELSIRSGDIVTWTE
ncbi:DUF192 domain-containing protein [Parasphingorhabdus sp.]|uniref:DUF192 domain-containing protein n=1 Tax=Parasphingorhabdus sp. TaxID=2709688 RepID=UPI003266F5DE